jgi:hypothetical protein
MDVSSVNFRYVCLGIYGMCEALDAVNKGVWSSVGTLAVLIVITFSKLLYCERKKGTEEVAKRVSLDASVARSSVNASASTM